MTTMTMSETMAAFPPRPQGPEPRPRLHSFSHQPTESITLSPAFIEALQAIAPRGRRRVLPYVLALLAVAVVVVWAGAPAGVMARALGVAQRASANAVVAAPPGYGAMSAAPALERAAVAPGVATLQVTAPADTVTVAEVIITDSPRTTKPSKKAPKKLTRPGSQR